MSIASHKAAVMGVLNVTPDSFFDGGRYTTIESALRQAEKMVADGADIIDVGGESTRPGAVCVSVEEELDRVVPVIKALVRELAVPISIDTRNTQVMACALDSGATFINDVMALQAKGAMRLAAQKNVPVCLMHMQGSPQTMQADPKYPEVIESVYNFLAKRIDLCVQAGIEKDKIYIDPGFGFGKTLEHNLKLMGRLAKFKTLGCKLLVGISRKTMFGTILNTPVEDRLYGSLAGALLVCLQGVDVIRTHDVKATKHVLAVYEAIKPFWCSPEQWQNQRSTHECA